MIYNFPAWDWRNSLDRGCRLQQYNPGIYSELFIHFYFFIYLFFVWIRSLNGLLLCISHILLGCFTRTGRNLIMSHNPSYKSHSALGKYPTMHHFVTLMCAYFKMVHWGIWNWFIVGLLQHIYSCEKSPADIKPNLNKTQQTTSTSDDFEWLIGINIAFDTHTCTHTHTYIYVGHPHPCTLIILLTRNLTAPPSH